MFRRQHAERVAWLTILADKLSQRAIRRGRTRLPASRLIFLASFLIAHFFPFSTSAQEKGRPRPLPPETGRIRITVPAGALNDRYWLYVDETLVTSPPYGASQKWEVLQTPGGEEVYSKGGLTAVVDSNGKVQYLNSALAQDNHFYRTLDLPFPPGTHTVEILIVGPEPNRDSGFPFLIAGRDLEVRRGQITEYAPDLPKGWNALSAYARAAMRSCLEPSTDPPDMGKLEKAVQWYKAIPAAKALRTAGPSYVSGAKRLVRLDLPPELGGSREFDDTQIQTIVKALQEMVDDWLPARDSKFDCDRSFPEFLAKYARLREVFNNELASFRMLARDAGSTR